MERSLRLHVLSSAIRVQPVRRPGTQRAASRQRAQRRWLGWCSQAGRDALSGQGLAHLFPGGRGLCNARSLRVPGGGADQIRDPVACQPSLAEQDWLLAQASGRATSERGTSLPCQVQLSSGKLDQAAPGDRQGRVASGRALSARRLHRHQLVAPGRPGCCLLQQALRTLATPEPIKDWSLTSLKEKLIKIGAKVVSHGRYVAFQMAEVAIPRQVFQEILRLIAELRSQPPPAPA